MAEDDAFLEKDGFFEIGEVGLDVLRQAIANAWLANADTVYPHLAAGPDPHVQLDVAARAAGAVFAEWLTTAIEKTRKG